MASHVIPFNAPVISKRFQRALCGELVEQIALSETPTCQDCAAALAQEDRDFQALLDEPSDPALLVRPVHFNPTDGYTPRGGRR